MARGFGKYQLIAQLGEGGMAQVYLAALAGPRGSGFSKLVVIKRLRSSYEDDAEFITMLVDEARIAARLNHPNVVQTHEVGDVDGKYFLAMEYLDGHSFHRIQNRSRAMRARLGHEGEGFHGMTKEMGYVILLDVLSGLHHAHELADYDGTKLGIVHRDITPPNIFVSYDGQVKVVDFGIAKAAGRGAETRHGVIKGKVRYMAPEQATGENVDRRADLFSVGMLLWEIAANDRRWKEESEVAIVRALLANEAYIPVSSIDPNVSPEIERIVTKALMFNPDERYQTADEFRRDLEAYLSSTGRLIETRSKLGPMVSELFKDKREELRQCIEKQLSEVSSASGSTELTPMMLTLHTDGDSRPSRRDQLLREAATPSPASLTPVATEPRSKVRTLIIAGVAVVAAAAVVVAAVNVTKGAKASMVNNTTNPTPAAAAVNEQVAISIAVTPSNAKVTIDGERVNAPHEVKVDRSNAPHTIHVEADGFESDTRTVSYDHTQAFSIALKSNAPAETAKPAAAATTPPTQVAARGPVLAAAPAPPKKSASATTATASTPESTASPVAAAATTTTNKPKRDIDRADPFAGSKTGPAKTIDKSNPFGK